MNTALALASCGKASDIKEGVIIGKNTVESGAAYKKLEDLIEVSGGNREKLNNLLK